MTELDPRLEAAIAARPNMFDPNLPLHQTAWDATCLSTYTTCPRKYYYSILYGWRHRRASDAINYGLKLHEALEHYDKLILADTAPASALDQTVEFALGLCGEYASAAQVYSGLPKSALGRPDAGSGARTGPDTWTPWLSADNRRTPRTLVRAVIWYADQFGAGGIQPLAFGDGTPAVELSFAVPLGGLYLLCGHMDGLATMSGRENFIRERKTTTTTLSGYYFSKFSPSTQVDTYNLVGRLLYGELNLRGTILEACQTGVTFCRFDRAIFPSSPVRDEEWLGGIRYWIEKAKQDAERNHWPQNRAACDMYGGCQYRGICTRNEEHRDMFLRADFEQKLWNPLEVR